MVHPNVFVSYSHDDEVHKAWVKKLATDLRSHGVNAILDQWDLRLGSDLRFFMENGLTESNLVLCICSENYVVKVNEGRGGSGYEGMIMTQELLKNAKAEYIIPVVRNNASSHKTPYAFGSKSYIDFSDDTQYIRCYQQLLERIYGEDQKKKPPLGENPFSGVMTQRIQNKLALEIIKYQMPDMDGHVVFQYDNNNGLYTIGCGDYSFSTKWSGANHDVIYAYGKIGYNSSFTTYPSVHKILEFDFSSNSRRIRTGEIVIFENLHNHFAAVKVGSVKSKSHGDSVDEISFDYHIYDEV